MDHGHASDGHDDFRKQCHHSHSSTLQPLELARNRDLQRNSFPLTNEKRKSTQFYLFEGKLRTTLHSFTKSTSVSELPNGKRKTTDSTWTSSTKRIKFTKIYEKYIGGKNEMREYDKQPSNHVCCQIFASHLQNRIPKTVTAFRNSGVCLSTTTWRDYLKILALLSLLLLYCIFVHVGRTNGLLCRF